MKNFYPELPIIPYAKTTVAMTEVIAYLQSLPIDKEIKRSCFCIFRNESANGSKGVNNNYIGFQSDSGRWQSKYDKYFNGVCIKKENGTGKERGFLCFKRWQDSIDILSDKLKDRGIYVGGTTHLITTQLIDDKTELAQVYTREWVRGSAKYTPTDAEIKNFVSMYNQASKLFM